MIDLLVRYTEYGHKEQQLSFAVSPFVMFIMCPTFPENRIIHNQRQPTQFGERKVQDSNRRIAWTFSCKLFP